MRPNLDLILRWIRNVHDASRRLQHRCTAVALRHTHCCTSTGLDGRSSYPRVPHKLYSCRSATCDRCHLAELGKRWREWEPKPTVYVADSGCHYTDATKISGDVIVVGCNEPFYKGRARHDRTNMRRRLLTTTPCRRAAKTDHGSSTVHYTVSE